jgi:hypothetical protein
MHFAPLLEVTMRCRAMGGTRCIWLMFALILAAATATSAQNSILWNQSPIARSELNPPYANLDENQQRLAQEMAKRGNLQRQEQMKADTERLFKLAEELRESVGKSNENILSIDVIKKANEIEKLAHSVKEKMRGPN